MQQGIKPKGDHSHGMSYEFFLKNINRFVGKHVVFTSRLKATGEENKGCAKKIHNSESFKPLKDDALMEIIKVEVM